MKKQLVMVLAFLFALLVFVGCAEEESGKINLVAGNETPATWDSATWDSATWDSAVWED